MKGDKKVAWKVELMADPMVERKVELMVESKVD